MFGVTTLAVFVTYSEIEMKSNETSSSPLVPTIIYLFSVYTNIVNVNIPLIFTSKPVFSGFILIWVKFGIKIV